MKKGWKIFWTVIISLTGAGVVFCIIALCLGVTFSQFEKAYPNGIGIIRKDYVSFEEDWDDDTTMMSRKRQKMLYQRRHFRT